MSGMSKQLLVTLILILLSMSCFGCPKEPRARIPDFDVSVQVICKRWNRDQWVSFNGLVQLAMMPGDPYNAAPAISAMGSMLKRCFPESFRAVPES